MTHIFLEENPIQKKKVRNGIFAYKFRNGTIIIETEQFFFYSMTDAIREWRRKHPAHMIGRTFSIVGRIKLFGW